MLDEGTRFAGRFTVLRELGEGGMGAVYAVRDEKLKRDCALKVLHARLLKKDPGARARFVREAQATGSIESDHVVQVLDFDENPNGVPWMLMELLTGETLEERVAKKGSLPLAEARRLVLQLGHALGAAHATGVVHMDLKPANVFLARAARMGEGEVVKVLDFGLARVIAQDRTSVDNTRGMGTYAWSAPEQYAEGKVHKSVDVWPLGLLAFWMLTGRQYWNAQNVARMANRDAALVREVNHDPIVAASARAEALDVAGRLPQGFDAWFARCVDRDPGARFADGLVATQELEKLLDAAERASLAPRPPRDETKTAAPSVPQGYTAPAPTVAVPELARHAFIDPTVAVPDLSWRTTAPMEVPAPEKPLPRRPLVIAAAALGVAGLLIAAVTSPSRSARPTVAPASAPPVPEVAARDVAARDVAIPPAAPPVPLTPPCPDGMTYVQGGSFTMGHDGDVANERPAHAATVEAFCVDAREVTWSDYQSCVRRGESNGCTANNEAWWENADAPSQRRQTELCAATSDPQRPAACVTWDMAQRYCQIRGGDLPTEAQWEFAARGSDGRAFPWGNEPPTATRMNGCGLECYAYWFPGQRAGAGDVLFADDDGAAVAVDVSRFTEDRSAAGVFGMGGNVSEWVRDCEGAYGAGEHPAEGATCRGTQPRRVARGGSWNSADAASVRATARTFLSAATQRVDLGFRCVTAPR